VILEDDPGAHRGNRDAAAVSVPSGSRSELLSTNECALNGLDGAARGVGLKPVGFHQLAVEGGRGDGDLGAAEVDPEHKVTRGADSVAIRHER
jgi:hypothetical protein